MNITYTRYVPITENEMPKICIILLQEIHTKLAMLHSLPIEAFLEWETYLGDVTIKLNALNDKITTGAVCDISA